MISVTECVLPDGYMGALGFGHREGVDFYLAPGSRLKGLYIRQTRLEDYKQPSEKGAGRLNVVQVKFKGYASSDYSYLTDLDLKVNDQVIVDSPRDGYVVVVVTKICGPLEGTKATKWVVSKVDDTQYKQKEEARRKKVVIETKLKAIEKQLESSMKYDYLAKHSPEAARLLEELKELKGL